MNVTLKYLAILLFVFCGNAFPNSNIDETDFHFQTSQTDSSIPNGLITTIAQDRSGFMWFGTRDGLVRFDGYKSTRYRHKIGDTESLKSNWISALLSDSKGRLWVGTYEGLQEFNFRNEKFENTIKFSESPADPELKKITSIVEDNEGVIWIGTKGGLFKYPPDSKQGNVLSHFTISDVRNGRIDVNALAVDAHNNLWIGSPLGLTLKKNNSDKFEQLKVNFPGVEKGDNNVSLDVEAIHFSLESKTLWIGTFRGLYALKYRNEEMLFDHTDLKRVRDVPADLVLDIKSDKLGHIWVGTLSDGVFMKRKSDENFTNLRHHESNRHSLLENTATLIFHDTTGILWVGSMNGLSKVDLSNSGFHHVSQASKNGKFPSSYIISMTGNSKGKIYLGTKDSGVVIWDRKSNTFKTFRHDRKEKFAQSRDIIITVTIDKRGRLWISTPFGIEYLDEKKGKFIWFKESYAGPQLLHRSIRDRNGNIWFATDRGLFKFDPETRKTIQIRPIGNGESSNEFGATNLILEDQNGNILLLTGHGIQTVDLHTNTYQTTNGLFNKNNPGLPSRFNSLIEDEKGRFWAATDEGIFWADRNTLPQRNGSLIPTEYRISGIVQDKEKKFWLSTSRGIASFDAKTSIVKYYSGSVMRHSGGNIGGMPFVDEDNIVYFAGINGVTYFNPNKIVENLIAPKIAIIDVQVLNKANNNNRKNEVTQQHSFKNEETPISVPYSQSSISIEYTALHFANPKENKYKYILENFDNDWIEVDSSKRYVQYSNLNPGPYRFKVKAASGNEIWSNEAVVDFIVAPPFWKSTSFWAIVTAVIILIAIIAQSLTTRRHKRIRALLEAEIKERTLEIATQNKNKSKFIADASHDLRQPIHAIGNLLEATKIAFEKKDREKSLELLQLTKTAASLMRSSFNSILELSRLETGLVEPNYSAVDLPSLVKEIISSFDIMAYEKAVKIKFKFNKEKNYFVRTDKILISRVFSNLISNAIKYSKSSNAKLVIRPSQIGSHCRLYILDNGIGIKEAELDKIFQPFYQINNPEHDRERGLGLGLSIVNATILALDDHSINVCSLPDKGTIFYIDLPLTTASTIQVETHIEPRKTDPFDINGLYIIYVEDDLLVRRSTEILLQDFGLLISSFSSGEELVEALKTIERKPDLILADHNLPNYFTSEDVIQLVRNEFDEKIPAIVITGSFIDDSFRMQSSADLVMNKPVIPSELICCIEQLFESATNRTNGEN
jgi:ligand-binding sensor domain-containing protein/signal transduction histidine kinase